MSNRIRTITRTEATSDRGAIVRWEFTFSDTFAHASVRAFTEDGLSFSDIDSRRGAEHSISQLVGQPHWAEVA